MNKNLTFSGTDTLAFIILPNTAPVVLGSLTTFSYSSYRVKRPVSTLGGIHIKGVAKGGRVIAGTMIFTMINKHWIKELCQLVPWLTSTSNSSNIYSDELPLFDIMIVSANEYGKYVSMMVYGIDLTDEAQVLSVNDMYSESTFNFIARELRNFDNDIVDSGRYLYSSNRFYSELKFSITNWGTEEDVVTTGKGIEFDYSNQYDTYTKDIQESLIDIGYDYVPITGILDDVTKDAIYDLMTRMEVDNEDFEMFYRDMLPYLDPSFIDNNNYYANGNIDTYIPGANDTTSSFGHYYSGERVIILGETTINDNQYYNTVYGYVSNDDVAQINNESSIIDVVHGSASIASDILYGEYIVTATVRDFLTQFYIITNTDTTSEYITNVMINSNSKGINYVKKAILTGSTDVNFADAVEHISEHYYDGIVVDFIVAAIDKDDSVIATVKFVGGI